MYICPNCGKENPEGVSLCSCGELLRADVTNVQSWETETVFRPLERSRPQHFATGSIVVIVLLTILALAWPQIREKWSSRSNSAPADEPVASINNSTRPDIIATNDIDGPDAVSAEETGAGVFDFSGRTSGQQIRKVVNTAAAAHLSAARSISTDEPVNKLDAELINDTADSKSADIKKDIPDCKPEITVALAKPDVLAADEKPAAKTADTKGYILGPRGGCFIVTPTGSKKYVDRSLCSSTAAARQ